MKTVPFRAVLIALIGLVALGSVVSVKSSSSGSVISRSTNEECIESGVTLVVEFSDDANDTLIKCIKDFSGSGWQIFKAARVQVTGTAEYPESFVCRINQWPSSETEACDKTPDPKNGTWVYFTASLSNETAEWIRSGQGAASHKPNCGDYEGWRFVSETSVKQTTPMTIAKPFRCNK